MSSFLIYGLHTSQKQASNQKSWCEIKLYMKINIKLLLPAILYKLLERGVQLSF